ncbi:tetratricopeptide repeat protein [Gulosibacter hominis]|uniref:tetratricopeptide repeat protein n=1 Tax=Gulosibacter hominis TaxID=2770504 RepID=UPI00191B0764|nr:tetratricopeptide repeat protein [Gulosibacter hominis]
MAELDDTLDQQINQLCARGDELAEEEKFAEAVAEYDRAWALLPEPKQQWNAATWILAAIGDAHVLRGDFAGAHNALSAAMHCPDAIGNPFIHLRLGQAQFELGNLDRAADELMRAYMGAGPEIFAMEDEKYLQFLATRAQGIEFPDAAEVDLD